MNEPEISGNLIVIPSDTAYLAEVDEFIEKKLLTAGLSRSEIADIAISTSEVVTNAIVHGNKCDRAKKVKVWLEIEPHEVRITVQDQGQGFDPTALPNPLAEENLLNRVGRGLFIVRSLVDAVDFDFSADGTKVTIKKRITS